MTVRPRFLCVLLGSILLGACGGSAQPAAPASSAAAPASAAVSPKPAASASAAAKPAASAPASAAAKPAASGLTVINVGQAGGSAMAWADYIAEDEGFFAKLGIQPKVVAIGTPATAEQALVGGSIEVSEVVADAQINAIEAGAPIAIVGQLVGTSAFGVYTQPDIKSWDDMKGATVGVSGPNDGAAVTFRVMANQKGLAAQKDYSFVPVGTTPARYAALQAKQIKAAMLTQPVDFEAEAAGYPVLVRSQDVLPHWVSVVVGVQKAWASSHRDLLTRYLTGLAQATRFIYDPKNKAESIKVLRDRLKTTDDAASKTYALWIENGQGRILEKDAKVDMEGLQVYGKALKDLGLMQGDPDPNRWVDLSYAPTL